MENFSWIFLLILAVAFFFFSKLSNVQKENKELKNDMGQMVNLFVKHSKNRQNKLAHEAVAKQQQEKNKVILRPYDQPGAKTQMPAQVGPSLTAPTNNAVNMSNIQNTEEELTAMFA
jgi:hypothetical protein